MSWYNIYRFSQNTQQIRQIATRVRDSLLRDDKESLQAMCLPVSRHLAQILIDNGFGAANVVQGTFTIDNPNPEAYEDWDVNDFGDEKMMESAKYTPLHYWVQINNIVVDITADQFNDEMDDSTIKEVEIGDINSMYRYTVITENYVEPRIMYDGAV